MSENNLPTEALKDFGIMNEDNSFHKKLTPEDIKNLLQGKTIVAENNTQKATFKLTDNFSNLEIKVSKNQRNLKEVLADKEMGIKFIPMKTESYNSKSEEFIEGKTTLAFVYDKEHDGYIEYDLQKNPKEVTEKVIELDKKELAEHYKYELLKMREFLLQKISKFPEIAKEIKQNLNIVSNEINTVSTAFPSQSTSAKQNKGRVSLDVNDPDLYQDANLERERQNEAIQEQDKTKGRSR